MDQTDCLKQVRGARHTHSTSMEEARVHAVHGLFLVLTLIFDDVPG